jgi:hypothetical protein
MKGDFSNWRDERKQNFNGVLHQQGRVLLDADWNAQTAITNGWQDTAGQDIIGAGVAAVPADQPDGFKIKTAVHAAGNSRVQLTVAPGRVWADGLLAELFSEPDPDVIGDVTRWATYLTPPVQPGAVAAGAGGIASGVRDAVVLEVWREEINGFQIPSLLIEPALGGPDTTERVHTSMAFRLMRLGPTDTCEKIRGRLQDDFGNKGKLKATLQPPTVVTGECPTLGGGGYTGFEHQLYRIEIADVNSGPPQFKWSQFGGGLVGRGNLVTGSPNKIQITANLQAIASSGLSSFYLEALAYDNELGRWRVKYGVMATLSNGDLTLGTTAVFGTVGPAGSTFFRLWNGIELVRDANTELPNQVGIFLDFDNPAPASKYVPGDYWTFPVRAGEIRTPEPLVGNDTGGGLPPRGIHYHRVPLAVLAWSGTETGASTVPVPIEDCRHIFQPLTRLATCCSYRVGDGMDSWGDFQTIKDAIAALPAEGGEICVLPGRYNENVFIEGKHNITIKGCGGRSRISPGTITPNAPIFRVVGSRDIKIESLTITAHHDGVGVLLEGPDIAGTAGGTLRGITLEKLSITAATRCAIETHIGFDIMVRGCEIEMSDEASDAPGIFFAGDDSLIENNNIRVLSDEGRRLRPSSSGQTLDTDLFSPAIQGRGGLNIGGTSERVRVVNNLIQGGTGTGITLGTLAQRGAGGALTVMYPGAAGVVDQRGQRVNSAQPPAAGSTSIVSAGALHEICIEHNRIYNMGANGIGVAAFFDLSAQDEFISIDNLTIIGNDIRNCLGRDIEPIRPAMQDTMGYGGIALADVEYLVVRDNVIKDNGPNYFLPICGIFVLHGEGIEISRNLILNNGANTGLRPDKGALPGARGGIYISYGIAPRLPVIPRVEIQIPAQNGVPAVKIHNNIVSSPLGQALAMVALGPVSVVENQFTSLGVVGSAASSTFWAATVLIFNLGLSNELYTQLLAFSAVAQGQVRSKQSYGQANDGNTLFMPQPGLDDRVIGGYLANGNVLFSNNQCTLNLMDQVAEGAISSVMILSLDDVSFHGNQCDCDLFFGDLIFTQAILFGISLRVTDNRFKEAIFGAWLSAVTLGMLNMTTDNQSTHCLMILGAVVEDQPNSSLLDVFSRNLCAPFRRVGKNFGRPAEPTKANQNTATRATPARKVGRISIAPAA